MWILFLTILFGTELIDLDMNDTAKKKTGVFKLTEKEKRALQHWIDCHYEKRFAPIALQKPEENPHIQENLPGGRLLRFSDESLWRIHPRDIPIAQGWITPVQMIVSPTQEKSPFSTKLINTLTGSSVRARKIE